MKITDEMIKMYCDLMGYKLLSIDKIAFSYIKPNGEKAALLKAAAAYNKPVEPTASSNLLKP